MKNTKVKETYFQQIDLFSKSFEFTFGGKEKFKSNMGGYFTILTFFVVVYMIWLLGSEILLRNMPKDYQVISIKDEPRNMTWEVPTGFMVLDNRGTIFKQYDRYLTFESYYWDMERRDGKFKNVTEPLPLEMRKCTPSDFSDEVYKDFLSLSMDSALCVAEKGLKLGGDFGMDFARFVSVRITPCYNTSSFNNCLPKEESLEFLNLKNLVVSVKSEKILYKSKNFGKPMDKFISEDNILIDPYIFNFPAYRINEFTVDTDEGLIGTSNSAQTSYEYTFYNDIITAFDNEGKRPDDLRKLILYEYTFFESSNVKTQMRSYLKLTDTLASVGGILKVYILIFNFAFHQIYQRIMYEQVITQLFNFEKVNKYKRKRLDANQDGEVDNKKTTKLFMPSNTDRQQSELGNNPSELTTKPFQKSHTIFQRDNFLAKVENRESELGSPTSTNNRLGANKSPSIITNNNQQPPQQPHSAFMTRNSGLSASSVSVMFAKNKMKNSKRNREIFTIWNHINLSFFPFCTCCSRNLKSVNDKFIRLIEYMYNYIDVLQMMKQFHELERLKFVMFNKKQLSIFQNIGIPEDPLHHKKIEGINSLYKFQYDQTAQKKKAQEFFKDDGENDTKIDQRLKKFYLNN
jgi:hypothetical protein